ncbi:hypothetical protein [Arsenicibacter rosenii]|nr:hypothetical protein [Arsenicibacter rosenii]
MAALAAKAAIVVMMPYRPGLKAGVRLKGSSPFRPASQALLHSTTAHTP